MGIADGDLTDTSRFDLLRCFEDSLKELIFLNTRSNGFIKGLLFFGASFVPSFFLAGYFLGGYYPVRFFDAHLTKNYHTYTCEAT